MLSPSIVERRPSGGDEVQLLVRELGILAVRLDDVVAGLVGGVGVAAERPDPERQPDRVPSEAPRAGNRLDLVQMHYSRGYWHGLAARRR